MSKNADFTVVTTIHHIAVNCPHCDEDLEISYNDFVDMAGECCDWAYSSIDCHECNENIKVNTIDWD